MSEQNVSHLQAERRRAEREPRDWGVTREALIASGMVEERRQARETERAAHHPFYLEANAAVTPEVALGAGLAQASEKSLPAGWEGHRWFHCWLYGEPVDFTEDRLP